MSLTTTILACGPTLYEAPLLILSVAIEFWPITLGIVAASSWALCAMFKPC